MSDPKQIEDALLRELQEPTADRVTREQFQGYIRVLPYLRAIDEETIKRGAKVFASLYQKAVNGDDDPA